MTVPAVALTPRPDDGLGVGAFAGEITEALTCATRDDYTAWLRHTSSAGGCSHPIRLRGEITDIDPTTGEVLRQVSTDDLPDGVIYAPCGTRRAAICPACAETYRRDAYQLVRAGLVGGKTIPETVTAHPAVFATFTAPSFGPVHTRVTGPAGRVLRCRPRRKHTVCPHGRSLSCSRRHKDTDACLGKPLCPDCYDYDAAVVWNAHAPELWRRTTITLRRYLDRMATPDQVKLSYAKVAEFQARGVIHFHALIRLDSHNPHDRIALAPPAALTVTDLADAIRAAVAATWFATVPHPTNRQGWDITWGAQLDIRPVRLDPSGGITSGQVAGYLAKYATKAAEPVGLPAVRITADNLTYYAGASTHHGRLVRACWRLGTAPHDSYRALRRWAHMAGYRGHFLTKSRHYSVTFKTLRAARATWRRRHDRLPDRADSNAMSLRLMVLDYAGTGWHTSGDALLALSAAARARDHDRIAREETTYIA